MDNSLLQRPRRRLLQAIGLAALSLTGASIPLRRALAQTTEARRTVTFYGNVSLSVPQIVRRVATAWEAENSIITMLGYGDRIVATTRIAKSIPAFRQIVPSIKDAALASNGAGNDVNVEALLALHPDILFVSAGFSPVSKAQLEAGGIVVAALRDQSLSALVERTLITGQLLGADAYARAVEYQQYFAYNQKRIAERLAKVPPAARLKVYLAGGSPLRTSGRPSLDQDWMDSAGAINIAEHWQLPHAHYGSANTSVEAILAANPDVIISLHANDADMIRTDPQWQQIKAVKNGRVYANPKGLFWWSRETTEQALQGLWLASTLYPDAFSDIDMAHETQQFYQRFYRVNFSASEIASFLHPSA